MSMKEGNRRQLQPFQPGQDALKLVGDRAHALHPVRAERLRQAEKRADIDAGREALALAANENGPQAGGAIRLGEGRVVRPKTLQSEGGGVERGGWAGSRGQQ